MGEVEKDKQLSDRQAGSRAGLVIGVAVVLIVAGLVLILVNHYQKQAAASRAVVARQAANRELGLPLDYPCDIVPVYEGVAILQTERDSAESTLGEPMDKWVINGEIDAQKEPVKEFYSDLLIAAGFSQQSFIGLPTGYGMTYANEDCAVDLVIEFRPPGELLKVDITIHRLRK